MVNLPPRSGKLLPWASPPLSLVNTISVSCHRPVLFSVFVTFPTSSSSAETIAWTRRASLWFWPSGAPGYIAVYCSGASSGVWIDCAAR